MAEVPAPAKQAQPPPRAPMAHRVHSSCDRCRSRKTKCIDPVPGPCRYCARTGAVCSMATPRRKRPYYHVTEEEYQCSMRILQHFFPNRELNQQSLRAIAKDIADGTFQGPSSSPKHSESSPAQEHTPSEDDHSTQEPEAVTETVNDLHEPLGCMMRDSRGKFRYVGAHSEIPFNAAVVALGTERKDKEIIPGPKVGAYPPTVPPPADVENVTEGTHFYMPPQDLCSHYVSRFLADVHCTYWLYPVEGLLRRIDETYSETAPPPSSSWVCSLYGIFAIGAANYEQPNGYGSSPQSFSSNDEKNSEDYIALARQLIPSVYDEADIDSIRALTIMSLAFENMCSRVSSYLYMGASIQMAYSLGLHRDPMPESGASMEREQNRRIWWTLFILDQEVASRGGSPTLIDERHLQISTPFPSEQILYPGLDTPPSWLSTSVSLCRLKREIIQTIYTERAPDANSVSFSTISTLLLALTKWHQQIPAHLKHDIPLPPTQKRSVAVLHLQYWGTTILLTRPFLLNLVLKQGTLDANKKVWFERMGKTCIDAAQKSIAILQQMAADNLLSSLTAADSTCILRITMIFILAYAHTKMHHYRTHIETAMSIIRGMERVGFCKMVAEETPLRLDDLGITEDRSSEDMLDVDIVTQLWGNFDPNFLNPLQSQQTLDLAFDDAGGTFDLNSEMLQFTNLDDSIIIDPGQAYPEFGLR